MNRMGLLAFVACAGLTFGAENYAQWKYTRNITVNTTGSGANVSPSQIQFPVLLRLNSGNFDFSKASRNGEDIRFTKTNGTRLAHHTARWDSAGQAAEIWILADSILGNANTTFRMYWGKSGAADSASATTVFSTANHFQAVFHMDEAANDTIRDITSNGFKGVPRNVGGTNPTDVPGAIGKAKNFLGSNLNNNGGSYRILTSTGENTFTNNVLNFQNDSSTSANGLPMYTVSAWIYVDAFPDSTSQRKGIISKSNGVTKGAARGNQYMLQLMENNEDPLNLAVPLKRVEFNDGVAATYQSHTGNWDAGSWVQVTAVRKFVIGFSGSSLIYINGRNPILSGTNLTQTTRYDYNVTIGSFSNDSGFFNGKIDEVSFADAARDSNWIKLTYETQKPNETAVAASTVQDQFPSLLTYASNPATFAVGIPALDPASVHGIATHYSISPALPPGFILDSVTGAISGTPTVISSPTNYTVTATSPAGSTTATLNVRVLTPPSNLNYTQHVSVYGVNLAIANNVPTVSGDVTRYSVSPALPLGLVLDTSIGIISGTPIVALSSANYTVTASNPAASTTRNLDITVLAPPSSFTYLSPRIYPVGVPIVPNTPMIDTPTAIHTVSHYSVTPALPSGLILDSITGVLSGTPTTVTASANYTVTAANVAGSVATVVNMGTMLLPSNLTYTTQRPEYPDSVAIAPNSPTVTGVIARYSVSPALPTGLILDTLTGVISGTPTVQTPTVACVITATNAVGFTTDTLRITVTIAPPSNLHYSPNTAVYGTGVTIAGKIPTVTGTATHYSVVPSLPAGLVMDPFSGVISGTPTAAIAATNFVVTASNLVGSTQDTMTLVVLAAPTGFIYGANPAVYGVNVPIVNDSPGVTGTVTGYSVNPPLPPGLALNPSTGVISGTPVVIQPAANYTVTAFNGPAFTTVELNITVLAPPTALHYSSNPGIYGLNVGITHNNPTVTGTVTHYAVSPSLPSGLQLDSITGVISGTPALAQTAASYLVTASNIAGFDTEAVTITVLMAPAITYSPPPGWTPLWSGVPVTPISPIVTGVVNRYSISPPLPTGLKLDSVSGVISGTPTSAALAANYTVTASNIAGSGTAIVNFKVYPPPSVLSYTSNPATYGVGVNVAGNIPMVTDTVTHYSVSPALPAGISLDSISGILSGTPIAASANSVYVVTASNPAGSTSVPVSIRVLAAPTALSYAVNSTTYGVNVAIANDSPSVTGTATHFSVNPPLPAGVLLDSNSGVISGTPGSASVATNYTVTASNVAGSTTATLNIRVLLAPAGLSYSSNPATFGLNVPIVSDSPTVTGTVTRYSVSPSLPAGLSLDSNTGLISGTPVVASAATNYTVSGTNAGGTTTVSLNIRILAAPASLAYSPNPAVYGVNAAIANNVPTLTGTATRYSVSPALPSGLTLDTLTGTVSGTPTAARGGTNYTITAFNIAGSTTAILNIRILAAPANLSYVDDPTTYVLGIAILPNTPSVTGFVTRYSVATALPPGLVLDSVSGIISGIPSGAQSFATYYTITGGNVAGLTQTTVNITIVGPPSNLSYADDAPTYGKGVAINPPSTPVVHGIVTDYSVTPSFPSGILLDGTTGYIQGTPTVLSAASVYTITARNPGGSSQTTLTLGVILPP